MSDNVSPARRLFSELRRRRVFRTAALYVVGTWLVLQVSDVVFPALDIPERAIRYLLGNWNLDTSFQANSLAAEYRCEGLFGWPCDPTSFGTFPEFRSLTSLSYDVGRFSAEIYWHWIDEVENALTVDPNR